MKIKIAGINNEINLFNSINVIEIEDKNLFRNIILKINNCIINKENCDELILLDENNNKLEMHKNISMYIDIFNIDFNSKEILNKICSKVEKNLQLERSIDNTYEKISKELINYMIAMLNDLPIDCEINEELQIKDLLKVLGIKINLDQYYYLEEKITFLFDIVSEFKLSEILIFANLKSYFYEDKLEEIYKYAISKGLKIVLIENQINNNILKYEKKLYIDKEYDDFNY